MSVSKMKKLTAFSHKSDADRITRRLMYLKCVDIEKADTGEGVFGLDAYECNEQRAEAESNLKKINTALGLLYKYSQRKKSLIKPKISVNIKKFKAAGNVEKAFDAVNETCEVGRKREELLDEKNGLIEKIEAMRPWENFSAPLNVESTKHAFLALGSFPSGMSEDTIDEKLAEADAYGELVSEDSSGIYALVCAYYEDEEKVLKALSGLGFVRASFRDVDTTATAAIRNCGRRIRVIDSELQKCEDRLRTLAMQLDKIEVLADIEGTSLFVSENKQKMVSTERTVMLEGWVPEDAEEKVREVLDKHDCAYDFEEPAEGDDPPILLKNNSFARNFEWVLGMYSYPKYGTFDPTFIMSIFYFVIFGLMFADVGYGLLLSLACFGFVKFLKPQEGTKRFMLMFGYCGISSMIMGVIFGGYFGDLPGAVMTNLLGIENPPDIAAWFNPLDDPMTFLIISLGVGAVHLVAGMAVKFVIISKEQTLLDAVFDIGSWWVLFAGLGLLFVSTTAGAAVAGVGVLMLILTQGRHEKKMIKKIFKGVGSLYNLISYISDLLSYSRILALGLVAGVISQVINLITMMGNRIIGFFFMLIVLIVGHLLNIAINVLGTFVHTSRLQYIEFFGKFYEDGGRAFKPAKPSDKYTVE